MKVALEIDGRRWSVQLSAAVDISVPLDFDGPQPNAFGLPRASSAAFEVEGFVGDTRRGGSVNCETMTLSPHGNGTHTECVGHIIHERAAICRVLRPEPVPATLITVSPVDRAYSAESYNTPGIGTDQVITARALGFALGGVDPAWLEGLVIRTMPGGPDKGHRRWSGSGPAFFTLEAMREVRRLGVRHLLVDLPSVDREVDGGRLAAHHIFWGVAPGSRSMTDESGIDRTITEMILVPDAVSDGQYLLSIQVPPFLLDAAPSRPILYPVEEIQA